MNKVIFVRVTKDPALPGKSTNYGPFKSIEAAEAWTKYTQDGTLNFEIVVLSFLNPI